MESEKEKDSILVATFIKPSILIKFKKIMEEKKWPRAMLLRTIIEDYVNQDRPK